MLGLGRWKFFVDTMFYRGDAFITVADKNGKYDVTLDLPGMNNMPKVEVVNMQAEGSSLNGVAHTDMLKGKDIPFSITFDGDRASGMLKAPFIGRIRLNNGMKVG